MFKKLFPKQTKKLSRASSSGFTLIEILVATSILVMVGVAAIGVEKNFMSSGSTNKHRLQATALAQEGISAVRRDFNTKLLTTGNLEAGEYVVESNGNIHKFDAAVPADVALKTITQNGVTFTRTITIGQ